MPSDRPRWRAKELERSARRAREALDDLLAPSTVRKGTVLADLVYRSRERPEPDGFPPVSVSAAPALEDPASSASLRTRPDDPARRAKASKYAGSPVEAAVIARESDVCDRCDGSGDVTVEGSAVTCRQCDGSGRGFADPIGAALDDLFTRLVELSGHAAVIDRRRQSVLHAADKHPDKRRKFDFCDGCHRDVWGGQDDPIRRGLCDACRKAYDRWRVDENRTDDENADRARFCEQRERFEGHVDLACERCISDEAYRQRVERYRHVS